MAEFDRRSSSEAAPIASARRFRQGADGASGYDPHKFDHHPRWHCRTLIKLGYLGAVEPEKPQPKKPTKIKTQKPQTRPATTKPAKKTAKPAAKPANPAQPTKPVAKAA